MCHSPDNLQTYYTNRNYADVPDIRKCAVCTTNLKIHTVSMGFLGTVILKSYFSNSFAGTENRQFHAYASILYLPSTCTMEILHGLPQMLLKLSVTEQILFHVLINCTGVFLTYAQNSKITLHSNIASLFPMGSHGSFRPMCIETNELRLF